MIMQRTRAIGYPIYRTRFTTKSTIRISICPMTSTIEAILIWIVVFPMIIITTIQQACLNLLSDHLQPGIKLLYCIPPAVEYFILILIPDQMLQLLVLPYYEPIRVADGPVLGYE